MFLFFVFFFLQGRLARCVLTSLSVIGRGLASGRIHKARKGRTSGGALRGWIFVCRQLARVALSIGPLYVDLARLAGTRISLPTAIFGIGLEEYTAVGFSRVLAERRDEAGETSRRRRTRSRVHPARIATISDPMLETFNEGKA